MMEFEDDKEKIRKFFNKMAKKRDDIIKENPIIAYETRKLNEAILKLLSPQKNDVIVDLGCGNGRQMEILSPLCKTFIGIDFSEEMIKQAKLRASSLNLTNVGFAVFDIANIMDLSFTNKILCVETLEHVPQWKDVILNISRIANSDSIIIISTPNRKSLYGVSKKEFERKNKWFHPHDDWKTYEELKEELEKNGFEILKVKGACYAPGFTFSYQGIGRHLTIFFLPLIETIEDIISNKMPFCKWGYTILIKAKMRGKLDEKSKERN